MTEASALPTGRFGPSLTGGPGRSGPQPARIVLALLAVIAGLAVMAAGTLGSLVAYGQAEMSQVNVGGLDPDGAGGVAADGEPAGGDAADGDDADVGQPVEETDGVVNVLAIGSDSREGLSDDELRRLGTERADGMRTDTIMLVQLDLDADRVSLLSFPRDLLVTRCDDSRGRINAAYAIGETDGRGGPTCLVETITDLTGVPIQHYVQVDFAGFIDVVDALGGVSIWLDEPLQDAHAGVDLDAGCIHMDGPTALGYVRSRRADGEGDFGRIDRQQRFLSTVLDDAISTSTLVNVPRMFSLVGSAARAVETNEELGLGEMRSLAFSMRDIELDAMEVYTVPGHNRQVGDAWMVVSDEDEAEALYAAFRDATDVPEGVGVDEPGDVTVDDVPPVTVLDGSDRAELPWDVASALEREGFTVADTGEVDETETTEVRFAASQREEAELVAEALGGAELVEGRTGESLTVTLGADFDFDVDAFADAADRDDTAAPGEVDAFADDPTPTPDSAAELARQRC